MSGDLTSRLIVRLIDGVSAPAAKAAVALRGLVGVSEKAAVAGRGTGKAIARDIGMVNRGVQRLTSSAAMPLGLIGAMGARTVYEYSKVGNALQAVTGLTKDQRSEVEKLASDLNKKFPTNLADIMGAAFELGRAGLDYEQILGGLEGTLQLGLSGDIAIEQAADIATNILTSMRLPQKGAEQTAQSLQNVNDVLARIATSSRTDVRMMGETLKYVGPIAAAAGLSLEQVGAASLVMAKNGIFASEAGVAMRSALVRMVRPTKPMLDALERLKNAAGDGVNLSDFIKGGRQITSGDIIGSLMSDGIDASAYASQIDAVLNDPALKKSTSAMTAAIAGIVDESGSLMDKSVLAQSITDTLTSAGSEIDFYGFIRELRERGADLSDIARIFDARQGSRLITLLSGDLDAALEEVVTKSKGAAAKMAEIRMDGIVGQVNRLTSAWTDLFVKIGEAGVLETIGEVFDKISGTINRLSSANPQLLRIGTYAGLAVIALAPLGMAFTAIGGLAGFATGAIGLLGSAIAVLGAPAMLAIGAFALAGAAIWYFWDQISAWASKVGAKLGDAASWFGGVFAKVGSAIGEGVVAAAEWVGQAVVGLRDKIVTYLSNSLEAIGRIDLSSAGAAIMRSLWEGMKSIFNGLVGWVSGIPAAIRGALPGGGGGAAASGGGAAPPARARGGHVSRGRSYLVGEHRPEIFTPGQSGYVNSRVPEVGRGGAPVTITQNFNLSGLTDPEAFLEKVKRALEWDAQEVMRGLHADIRTSYSF